MVARFVSGKSIKGAFRYNENKVAKGKAEFIHAEGYPKDREDLTKSQRLDRLMQRTALNERVKTNCVHISLNFHTSDRLNNERIVSIARTYMDRIGFGEQPYLIYRHFDAAHPHIHIVSTNIQADGRRIPLHNIGRNQSEMARKEIEKMFGLVIAENQKHEIEFNLNPVYLKKVEYGKSPSKDAISNIVRGVVRHWKFSSLAEFNAILRQYNLAADPGREGSMMNERGGLLYSILDEQGDKIGVPIKASSIYSRPTLSSLKEGFEANKEAKLPYRHRIRNIIDRTIEDGSVIDRETFSTALEREGIKVVYIENTEGIAFGITFLDNRARVVFKGSDLGKRYSLSQIIRRLGETGREEHREELKDKQWLSDAIEKVEFTKGFAQVLVQLFEKDVRIRIEKDEEGGSRYSLGHYKSTSEHFFPAGDKMTAYLQANGFTEGFSNAMNDQLKSRNTTWAAKSPQMLQGIEQWISSYLKSHQEEDAFPNQLKGMKPKKHKANW